jgi:bifunctional non-homologous end joining protein LigD
LRTDTAHEVGHRAANLIGAVLLEKMAPFHRHFDLVCPGAAKLTLPADQDRAWISVDEKLRDIGLARSRCGTLRPHAVGPAWVHEIKLGFRVMARKAGERVRLYSRPGNDLTYRFPLIVEALAKLRSQSCIIDGEAVACGDDGIASFNRIRHRHHDADVFMWAFDLIELNGDDLRRDPLNVRKATLASVLARAAPGLRLNEHLEADGPDVFHHACMLGLEDIVSKRKDSQYRSGRSPHWIKSKNLNAPAVKREAEEDWGQCRG